MKAKLTKNGRELHRIEDKKTREKALKMIDEDELKRLEADNPRPDVQKGNGFQITIKVDK